MPTRPSKCVQCGATGRPYYVTMRITDDKLTYDLRKMCDRCTHNLLDKLDRDNAEGIPA